MQRHCERSEAIGTYNNLEPDNESIQRTDCFVTTLLAMTLLLLGY